MEARRDPAALPELREAIASARARSDTLYAFVVVANRSVLFLAGQGHTEDAVQLLQVGLSEHQWTPAYDVLLGDTRLAAVRKDPRFAPILEHSKAVVTAMLAVLDEARQNGELPGYLVAPLAEFRVRFGL
jgi:hypothetical protein